MKKTFRNIAKKYLQKTCKHNFKLKEQNIIEGYIKEKCIKCKLIKYSDV